MPHRGYLFTIIYSLATKWRRVDLNAAAGGYLFTIHYYFLLIKKDRIAVLIFLSLIYSILSLILAAVGGAYSISIVLIIIGLNGISENCCHLPVLALPYFIAVFTLSSSEHFPNAAYSPSR